MLMLTPVHMFNVLISIARGIHAGGNVRRDRKFGSKRLRTSWDLSPGSRPRLTPENSKVIFSPLNRPGIQQHLPHSAPIHHVDAEVRHGILKIIRLLLGEKKLERARRDRASY